MIFMLVHQLCKVSELEAIYIYNIHIYIYICVHIYIYMTMASRSHDFDMNLNIFCLNTSFQDRSMRSVQQFEDLAMLLEMPLYEDLPTPALERLWAVGFLTVEISMPWMPWIWIRMLDFLRWRSMQAPLDRGFYTEFRYVKDVERRARRGENCVIDHP